MKELTVRELINRLTEAIEFCQIDENKKIRISGIYASVGFVNGVRIDEDDNVFIESDIMSG